jgi:hypothetical protein
MQHPYNKLRHIIEVRRVGARGLMFNEIKYDHKDQQGVRLKMNKCQEEQQHY